MGIIDCLIDDKGIVGYLYDTVFNLIKSQVTADVEVLTMPRKRNDSDMPEQYAHIAIYEMPLEKHSLSPCSYAQGLSIVVETQLPYHKDELSRQLIRSVQALFHTQLEYAMIVLSAKTKDTLSPLGKQSVVIVDVTTILNRG